MWSWRSRSMKGTVVRISWWAARTPRPALTGRRMSIAWAATNSSIGRQVLVCCTTWRALSAGVIPIETWSSRLAEEGMESTDAGWQRIRDSATSAAEVTWAIMKPELSPGFFARKGGNPESERSEEHTSELQSHLHVVCRLLPEK